MKTSNPSPSEEHKLKCQICSNSTFTETARALPSMKPAAKLVAESAKAFGATACNKKIKKPAKRASQIPSGVSKDLRVSKPALNGMKAKGLAKLKAEAQARTSKKLDDNRPGRLKRASSANSMSKASDCARSSSDEAAAPEAPRKKKRKIKASLNSYIASISHPL